MILRRAHAADHAGIVSLAVSSGLFAADDLDLIRSAPPPRPEFTRVG